MRFSAHEIFKHLDWLIRGFLVVATITIIVILSSNQLSNATKLLASLTCLCVYYIYSGLYRMHYIDVSKKADSLNRLSSEYDTLIGQFKHDSNDDLWAYSIMNIIQEHNNRSIRKFITSIFSASIFIQSILMMTTMAMYKWDGDYATSTIWLIIILHANICMFTYFINIKNEDVENQIYYNTAHDVEDHIRNMKARIEFNK